MMWSWPITKAAIKRVALGLGLGAVLLAAGEHSAVQGRAGAFLARPITLQELQSLDFGTLLVGPGRGGRVQAQLHHAVKQGGDLSYMPGRPRGHGAAFRVAGQPGSTYTVRVPEAIEVIHDDHGDAMPVALGMLAVQSDLNRILYDHQGEFVLPAEGTDVLWVAGVLQVEGQQRPGRYRGQFDVVVAYQ